MIVTPLWFFNNDTYKYTMQQAVLELYPDATVMYRFVNRGKQRFNEEFVRILKICINQMIGILTVAILVISFIVSLVQDYRAEAKYWNGYFDSMGLPPEKK